MTELSKCCAAELQVKQVWVVYGDGMRRKRWIYHCSACGQATKTITEA